MTTNSTSIQSLYDTMLSALGPSEWWPADSPLEVAIGAVLTQNTNWHNVEKAFVNLKERDLVDGPALLALPLPELAELIRPAGYYNIKAKRLHNLLQFFADSCDFDFTELATRSLYDLRPQILAVNGVGPETCDAILLYVLNKPTFVIDTYTARFATRHGLASEEADYYELQELFMDNLPHDVQLFNEYHALIIRVGKEWCHKKVGLCDSCPLGHFLGESCD